MGVIELACGLSARTLLGLGGLAARSVGGGGFPLKLEWGVLTRRSGNDVEDILWWEGEHLVGFAGLYAFGPPTVELTGMVDPTWRRRGMAPALVGAALSVCGPRGFEQVHLVSPRASVAGGSMALKREARLDHSEHSLDLFSAPIDGPRDERVTLRSATATDAAVVAAFMAAAFGGSPGPVRDVAETPAEQTLMIEVDGTPVGTVRLTFEDAYAGIYGFAIDPPWQGRGIGRNVLRRVCIAARARRVERVLLELASDNDRALGLYTSIGFTRTSTEDYYALPRP